MDPVKRQVTWTPGTAQVGKHRVVLEVSDGAGGKATQEWEIEVFNPATNRDPIIISTPVTRG